MLVTASALVGLSGLLVGCQTSPSAANDTSSKKFRDLEATLADIETQSGGRLGVAILDTQSGDRAAYRAGERFPMCSTFKLLAVAATLQRIDQGNESLQRRIPISQADLTTNSPVTTTRVSSDGMSVAELCEAAMIVSDNTAAKLLVLNLGGPAAITAYARSLGDSYTRLDRNEPEVNQSTPGDPRDTTTPAAMLNDLYALTLEDALLPSSRDLLVGWLVNNQSGRARLRAGVPSTWRVGDKTGAGDHHTTNDIGILWPPSRKPLLACVYLTESPRPADQRSAAVASVARAVAAAIE